MNQFKNLFRRIPTDKKCLDNRNLDNQEKSELTHYLEDVCFIKPLHPYTFKIPQICETLPEMLSDLKKNQSEILHIGILECGTISSFFEDSWNKLFEELKKSIRNSQKDESEWIKFISNAYLKRDWHRIWLVRCFMSMCWEMYIKDILTLDKNGDYDYLMLPCYSHSFKKVEKIPIGELLCITTNFLLDYLNPQIEIPLSTIRGVPILKKVIYYNKAKYWKTPPPFCVAKVALLENSIIEESNLENVSKYIKAEIWISLNIDDPKIYWMENYNNTTAPKLPADKQTFASCIRVLRKDEIGIFKSPFEDSIYSTFTLRLLDWYLEDTLTINYKNYILECPIIVKNHKIKNSTNETGIEINYNISSDSLSRKFWNGKISYENNKLPHFIIKIIEKYRKIFLPLTYQLLKNELEEPENFTCCRHLWDTFQMILSAISNNELYYIHLEINMQTIIQCSEILLFYILRHLNEYKYLCDYKYKFLDDLYNFGFFVLSKLKSKRKLLFIQNIYMFLVTDINIIKKLRILFHELLNSTKNWFEVPFVLIENDTILKSNPGEEFIYIITPSINKVQELIFYTFPGKLSVKSHPFLMKLSLENYSFSINDKFKQINSIVYNDIFSFINGKTLIEDLGQLEICVCPEDLSFSLSSNSISWLFESIDTQQILLSEDIGQFCYLIKSCLLILYFNYNTQENNRNLLNISVSSFRRWSQIFLINSKKIPKYYLIFGKYIEIIFKVDILGSIGYEDIIDILNYMTNKKYKTEERNVIQLCFNYVMSWIFIQIKNTDLIRHSNKSEEQLKLKDFIQSIYKIHRISRIELLNIKYQTFHHLIMEPIVWLPINPYEIGNRSDNKLAFFEKLIKFEIFNILFRLLISPIYANNIFKNDKFSITDKRQSNYKLVSFGNNKLGYLGIGPPRISIFREIECKLYPNLYDINCIYKNMGIELESSENEIQDIVLNLKIEEQIFKKLSCGLNHIIVLCKNGCLLSWGSNLYGQCAHNTQNSNLKLNINYTNIEDIHKEIINEYNQMISYPKKIYSISKLIEPVSTVTCGAFFTMILDSKGRVFTWGCGKDGCLGTGNLQSTSTPSLVSFNYPIKKISSGMFHCSAIDINCRLYTWGSNEAGQIGLALRETEDELSIIKIPQEICIEFVVEKIESFIEVKNIIILYHHTYNFDRTNIIKWNDISLGEAHSVGLDTDGLVWVWGQNNFNQLSSIPNLISPKLILRYIDSLKKDKNFFLNSKEKIIEFPIPLAEFILPSIKLFDHQKITKVICGSTTSCAIDNQGKLWMWGLVHSGIIEDSINKKESDINNISKVMYKEIPLPKKVFKNILIEDKTIKLLRFGQGTNNLIIVTEKEKCYIWLSTNISKNFKKSLFDSVKYNENYGCLTIDCNKNWKILDASTVSDSIIMIMKKKKF
ncbi:regulator of chromosome condensation family protein [Cryptosporidium serpentis]